MKTAKTGLVQPLFNENVCWRLITHVNSQGRVQIAKFGQKRVLFAENTRKSSKTNSNVQKWSETRSVCYKRVVGVKDEQYCSIASPGSEKREVTSLVTLKITKTAKNRRLCYLWVLL